MSVWEERNLDLSLWITHRITLNQLVNLNMHTDTRKHQEEDVENPAVGLGVGNTQHAHERRAFTNEMRIRRSGICEN